MSNTVSFILGILSSVFASFIIFVFRYHVGFIINFLFYKIYPNVSGEYNYYRYKLTPSNKKGKSKKNSTSLYIKPGVKLTNRELLKWLKAKKRKVHLIMKLKQFANKVSGEVYCIKKDEIIHLEKINGRITPGRILVLNSESKDKEHHNFGTHLLNLTNNLRIIKGTESGLCIECGDATSCYALLEKK